MTPVAPAKKIRKSGHRSNAAPHDRPQTSEDPARRHRIDADVEAWASDFSSLVSPPDVCVQLFDIIESKQATAARIGEVIASDPNLSARLLRVVNSPFYHVSRRIDTLSRAITVIGITELYNLVIAVSAVRTFSDIPGSIVDIDTFWRHSLYTAITARILARRCNVLHPERIFVTGLLHDIGSLVIYHRVPDLAKVLVLSARGDEDILQLCERQALGFNHAELGGAMLASWNLPTSIRDAISHHHDPGAAGPARLEASIVHIAEAYANAEHIGAFSSTPAEETPIKAEAWRHCGIDPDEIDRETLMTEAHEGYLEMQKIFSA